jgi:A nuclease family of the HNH/ENDO VII superfamily with conserved AHH
MATSINSSFSQQNVEVNNTSLLQNGVNKQPTVSNKKDETTATIDVATTKLDDLKVAGQIKKAELENAILTTQNPVDKELPKASVASKSNLSEKDSDGKIIGQVGKPYSDKTPLSTIEGVKPTKNGGRLLTNEPIIFVGGVGSDVNRDLDIQQKIADKTGAAVYSVHNSTEGMTTDLAQWNGDRAEMDAHHDEQLTIDKGSNPYKKFKTYAEYEKFNDETFGKNKATTGLTNVLSTQTTGKKDVRLFAESQGLPITSNALSRLKAQTYFANREAGIIDYKNKNAGRTPSGEALEKIEKKALSIAKSKLNTISVESYGGAGNFLPSGLRSSTHYVNKQDAIATSVGPNSDKANMGSNAEIVNLDFKNADGIDGLTKNHAIEFYLEHRADDKVAGRLSNSWTTKKNYLAQLTEKYKAQGLTGKQLEEAVEKEQKRTNIHHIIPDEAVQKTKLGQLAQKAGYNLDRSDNLIGLARSNKLKNNPNEVGHWTSHPNYTTAVEAKMDSKLKELQEKYKGQAIPKQEILDAMKSIEKEFRGNIQQGKVPQKDGRLAQLTPSETTVA